MSKYDPSVSSTPLSPLLAIQVRTWHYNHIVNLMCSYVGSNQLLEKVMKLKQVTLITILGIGASFALTLVSFPWGEIVRCPKLMVSFANIGLLHSALLFFLINLYRKG